MKRILFVQTAFIGDVLLGVPTLKRIRRLWPEARIDIVVRSGLSGLVKSLRVVDEVYEVKKGDQPSYGQLRKRLLATPYDVVFCPHRSLRTALLIRGVGKRRVGVKSWWNLFFFTDRISHDLRLPEPLRQISILSGFDQQVVEKAKEYINQKTLGAGGLPLIDPDLLAHLSFLIQLKDQPLKVHPDVRAFLQVHQIEKPILLAPGSVWATKKWGVEHFIELAKSLRSAGQSVVLIGAPDERELCDTIAASSGAISSAGQFTIPQSMELMTQARALVCNDSGPAHMAACLGLPTVSIFGPTVLAFGYRPWNNSATVVENRSLECRPCAKHGGKKCPLGTHECMKSIQATEVERSLRELLKKVE